MRYTTGGWQLTSHNDVNRLGDLAVVVVVVVGVVVVVVVGNSDQLMSLA